MPNDDGFDAMTDACIAAYEAVMEHGTPEHQTLARALLFAVAQELAGRMKADAGADVGE